MLNGCRYANGWTKSVKIKIKNYSKIAVVGKPNAGKSSLINTLKKSNELIVDNTPGTTRDIIKSELIIKEKKYDELLEQANQKLDQLQYKKNANDTIVSTLQFQIEDISNKIQTKERNFSKFDLEMALTEYTKKFEEYFVKFKSH